MGAAECLKRPLNNNRGRESVIEARKMRTVRESSTEAVRRSIEVVRVATEGVRVL